MSTVRKVTIYSTKGAKRTVIETNVTTWGELEPLVSETYDLDNMQAVENQRKTTLSVAKAELPEGDFTLFLKPIKTKAGLSQEEVENMSYSEARETVRDILNSEEEGAAEHFNEGRNYTNKPAGELRRLIASWIPESESSIDLEALSDLELIDLYHSVLAEAESRGIEFEDEDCDEECQELNALAQEANDIFSEED